MRASFVNLRLARTGATATITLANPSRRNALSADTMLAVIDALRSVAATDARAVVIDAEGPVFSAGHDFADMAGQDVNALRGLFSTCTDLMTLLQQIPQPVVAKVHALATAAGCQLVASCDLAIAARSASFALPGGQGGLFCTTPLVAVARCIGPKRALEMAMSGDRIDADTAAQWGLVNHAVPDEELSAAVDALVARVTRGSALSKAIGKAAFYEQVGLDQRGAYAHAIEVMAANAAAPDGQEGIASFLEKRPPDWPSER